MLLGYSNWVLCNSLRSMANLQAWKEVISCLGLKLIFG